MSLCEKAHELVGGQRRVIHLVGRQRPVIQALLVAHSSRSFPALETLDTDLKGEGLPQHERTVAWGRWSLGSW